MFLALIGWITGLTPVYNDYDSITTIRKNKVFGVKITKHILFFTEMKYYHFEISYVFYL